MLCEISAGSSLPVTWLALTGIGITLTGALSAIFFARTYWRPTYEQWRHKTNPVYPKPAMVRREILQFVKGIGIATIPPAISLSLIGSGWSQAYCGVGELGWGWLIASFAIVWVVTDFVEFYYHRSGHRWRWLWRQHRGHHHFVNPSPFSVVADDHLDQFVRALPMLLFPMLMPINMDVLFFTFALIFYGYGVYLHWGYELDWPDAHHPWLNTSFHHYSHHARAKLGAPYHTGFFFKLWDQLFESELPDEDDCSCAKCCVARGERTPQAWEALEKPDYSVLLEPGFWWKRPRRRAVPLRE